MAVQPTPRSTVDDYLTMERAACERHEYLDGHVYAMAGESPAHGQICVNLGGLLWSHLRGGPCQMFTKDMKVRCESPLRRARRMKQKDVATAVDISQKHLSQLELGGASVLNLSSGAVLALANTLQVSTDYLLGRTDDAGIAALGFTTVHTEASKGTTRASRRRRATPQTGAA